MPWETDTGRLQVGFESGVETLRWTALELATMLVAVRDSMLLLLLPSSLSLGHGLISQSNMLHVRPGKGCRPSSYCIILLV